jgi:hypothetical protein
MPDTDREQLGRLVRQVWVRWASEQRRPKRSWLVGWDQLGDGQREVDMRIGETVAAHVTAKVMGDLPALRTERDELRQQIEDLREFEREYRTRLKAFCLSQADILDGKDASHGG